jgi:hypothetical protein
MHWHSDSSNPASSLQSWACSSRCTTSLATSSCWHTLPMCLSLQLFSILTILQSNQSRRRHKLALFNEQCQARSMTSRNSGKREQKERKLNLFCNDGSCLSAKEEGHDPSTKTRATRDHSMNRVHPIPGRQRLCQCILALGGHVHYSK